METSYPKFILGNKITSEQQEFFNQHGFIHFKNFIKQETVNDIIQASEKSSKSGLILKKQK